MAFTSEEKHEISGKLEAFLERKRPEPEIPQLENRIKKLPEIDTITNLLWISFGVMGGLSNYVKKLL